MPFFEAISVRRGQQVALMGTFEEKLLKFSQTPKQKVIKFENDTSCSQGYHRTTPKNKHAAVRLPKSQ